MLNYVVVRKSQKKLAELTFYSMNNGNIMMLKCQCVKSLKLGSDCKHYRLYLPLHVLSVLAQTFKALLLRAHPVQMTA